MHPPRPAPTRRAPPPTTPRTHRNRRSRRAGKPARIRPKPAKNAGRASFHSRGQKQLVKGLVSVREELPAGKGGELEARGQTTGQASGVITRRDWQAVRLFSFLKHHFPHIDQNVERAKLFHAPRPTQAKNSAHAPQAPDQCNGSIAIKTPCDGVNALVQRRLFARRAHPAAG